MGAASMAAGNATAQLGSQAEIQWLTNSDGIPIDWNVAMKQTRNDIIPDRIKAKSIGAYLAGIIFVTPFCPRHVA